MTAPITLRLHRKDDVTEMEIRILHPMEAGDVLRDKSSPARQPKFLQSIAILLNDRTLVEGQLSASLSKNPRFSFTFSGVKSGDKFVVYCTDNEGRELRGEIVAEFSSS